MTFEQIWNSLLKKDDRLKDSSVKIEFKVSNFKKLLSQVYEQGQLNSKTHPVKPQTKDDRDHFSDMFKNMGL